MSLSIALSFDESSPRLTRKIMRDCAWSLALPRRDLFGVERFAIDLSCRACLFSPSPNRHPFSLPFSAPTHHVCPCKVTSPLADSHFHLSGAIWWSLPRPHPHLAQQDHPHSRLIETRRLAGLPCPRRRRQRPYLGARWTFPGMRRDQAPARTGPDWLARFRPVRARPKCGGLDSRP